MRSLTLTHRRAIDRSKESLVKAAEQLLKDGNVVDMRQNDFGHSQLRNAIAVSLETDSPAVVLNFIRYQMGRASRNKGWANVADERDGRRLGERFIDEIEKGAIAEALRNRPELEGDEELKQLAKIELIRHFMGFASRYMKFLELQRKSTQPANDPLEAGS